MIAVAIFYKVSNPTHSWRQLFFLCWGASQKQQYLEFHVTRKHIPPSFHAIQKLTGSGFLKRIGFPKNWISPQKSNSHTENVLQNINLTVRLMFIIYYQHAHSMFCTYRTLHNKLNITNWYLHFTSEGKNNYILLKLWE